MTYVKIESSAVRSPIIPAPLITDKTGGSAKPIEYSTSVLDGFSVLGAHAQKPPSIIERSQASDPNTQTIESAQKEATMGKGQLTKEEVVFGLTTRFTYRPPHNDDRADIK